MPNALTATLLGRLLGSRSIYFCGGGAVELAGEEMRSGNRLLRYVSAQDTRIRRLLTNSLRSMDVIIVKGRQAANFFRAQNTPARVEVIAGGIDSARYEPCNGSKEFDLIVVGRLSPEKRLDVFLETMRHLQTEIPNISAAIVGEGVLRAQLRAQAKTSGLEKAVRFTGLQKDVGEWLKKAKIFVLTSDTEGLALALIEAMMCGLPAVVSDVGETGDLVEHGKNGWLVKNRTSLEFARYIALLLKDDQMRTRFSIAARSAALQMDQQATTNIWDSILTQL